VSNDPREKALGYLRSAWPGTMTEGTFAAYADGLADIPADKLFGAIATLGRTSEFRPTIAAIRRQVIEHSADVIDDATAAAQWGELDYWAEQRQWVSGLTKPAVDPVVEMAFRTVGMGARQDEFLRAYRNARKAWWQDMLQSDLSLTLQLGEGV